MRPTESSLSILLQVPGGTAIQVCRPQGALAFENKVSAALWEASYVASMVGAPSASHRRMRSSGVNSSVSWHRAEANCGGLSGGCAWPPGKGGFGWDDLALRVEGEDNSCSCPLKLPWAPRMLREHIILGFNLGLEPRARRNL